MIAILGADHLEPGGDAVLTSQQRERFDRDRQPLVGGDSPQEDDLRLLRRLARDGGVEVAVAGYRVTDPLEPRLDERWSLNHALDRLRVPGDRGAHGGARTQAQRGKAGQRPASAGPDR